MSTSSGGQTAPPFINLVYLVNMYPIDREWLGSGERGQRHGVPRLIVNLFIRHRDSMPASVPFSSLHHQPPHISIKHPRHNTICTDLPQADLVKIECVYMYIMECIYVSYRDWFIWPPPCVTRMPMGGWEIRSDPMRLPAIMAYAITVDTTW